MCEPLVHVEANCTCVSTPLVDELDSRCRIEFPPTLTMGWRLISDQKHQISILNLNSEQERAEGKFWSPFISFVVLCVIEAEAETFQISNEVLLHSPSGVIRHRVKIITQRQRIDLILCFRSLLRGRGIGVPGFQNSVMEETSNTYSTGMAMAFFSRDKSQQ